MNNQNEVITVDISDFGRGLPPEPEFSYCIMENPSEQEILSRHQKYPLQFMAAIFTDSISDSDFIDRVPKSVANRVLLYYFKRPALNAIREHIRKIFTEVGIAESDDAATRETTA